MPGEPKTEPIALQQSEDPPNVAITVGDVAGVGPELAIRCAAIPEVRSRCNPILYGPAIALEQIAQSLRLEISCEVRDIGIVSPDRLTAGVVSAETGLASFQAVEQAIADSLRDEVSAIVTGPIQKEAWNAAGIAFPGHTELLAHRTGVQDFCMMLTSPEISCVLATIHIPLADVSTKLSSKSVLRAIRLGAAALATRTKRPARVTVCGLNPHAGENGLFSHGENRA